MLEEFDGLAAVDVGTLVGMSRMMDGGRDGGSCSEEWCVQYAQTPGGYLHVVEGVLVEVVSVSRSPPKRQRRWAGHRVMKL